MLASDDAPPRAALAEPVDLDRRDRREVAGHERQHARRDHREQPREERDRELLNHRSVRAPRRRAARRPRRARVAGDPPSPGARLRDQCQAPPASATAPSAMPPSGSTHAIRSKPCVCGVESTAGPSCATIALMIWLLRPAGRDVARDVRLHLLRERRVRLVERHVAARADELRLELAPGSRAACWPPAGRGERERRQRRRDERLSRVRARAGCRRRVCARDASRDDVRRHDAAAPVDEERLGCAGDAPVRPGRARARQGRSRYVDAVALQVRLRRAVQIDLVDAEEDDALRRSSAPRRRRASFASCLHGTQSDCQKLSTTTLPRSEARLSRPLPSTRGRSSSGAATIWPLSTFTRDPGAVLCATSQTSRPSSASTGGDRGARSDAHQTMNTVVPTSTWSNSHSASGTCMRMQPCEAL